MAWTIRKHKVPRRWMMDTIQKQQEVIARLSRVIVKARIVVTAKDLDAPLTDGNEVIVGPQENLGLPPFPDRSGNLVVPVTDPQAVIALTRGV